MKSEPAPIRVFITDNDINIRSALRCAAEQCPGTCICGEATSSNSLAEKVLAARADTLLLDWELSGDRLPDVLRVLKTSNPRLLVVVLASWPECRVEATSAGADYFIVKGEPPECLVQTLVEASARCRYS